MGRGNESGPLRAEGKPRIVVLQHNARDPLGALRPALAEGAEIVVVDGYHGREYSQPVVDQLVERGEYEGVVALGGPMAVYERNQVPFVKDSLRLVADALERGAPMLGICLGAQMMSEVQGSRVFNGAERGLNQEVGFFNLRIEEGQRDDPVISLFQGAPVLFWHQDTHDLPAGATRLAGTDLYDVAAFRVRDNAYGLQFHLETTGDILQVWVSESPLLSQSGADGNLMLTQAYALDTLIRCRAQSLAALFLGWAHAYRSAPAPAREG